MRISARIPAILCFTLLFAIPTFAANSEQPLTQRDLMSNLVDTLGYSFGLPDTPEDSDYIHLLEGTRSYRFEAETFRHPDDLVAVNNFSTFGEFSGPGWVSAISAPTMMRMNFLLPHAGTYQLYTSVRLPGHTLMIEGQMWKINEDYPLFQRVHLGEITTSAGMKEVAIAMPANGSIDYVEFLAPPLPTIAPLAGWDPDAPLTYADLAVTAVRALGLQELLPLEKDALLFEAEKCSDVKTFITDQRHLGEPHGGLWLRCNAAGSEIPLPFNVKEAAVYTFSLIAEGATSLSGSLDSRDPWQADFPPYLKEMNIGTWSLAAGPHELKIEIPPRGGIDLLTLRKRRSSPADYQILAGLPSEGSVKIDDINRTLTLLARLHPQD